MNKKEISDFFKDIPEMIDSPIEMINPNETIKIHNGEFIIKSEFEEITIEGEIFYAWMPNSGTFFKGIPKNKNYDYSKFFKQSKYSKLIINGLEFGESFITNSTFENFNNVISLKGVLVNEAVIKDKSISVDKIRFAIPNLKEFSGETIKKTIGDIVSSSHSRISLENDKYKIILDKAKDFTNLQEKLKESGGYLLLYSGELEKKKGNINIEESKDIFYCLNNFLTFINGRRTSALFMNGEFDGECKWQDFTDYNVDTYKYSTSWSKSKNCSNFNKIWKTFSLIWKDKDNQNFLTSAIHWYIESNNNSGFSEGSIIMAQTALELIYNWWIVENKKLIIGKDSENINASNKIRLILSQLNIDYTVPSGFLKLQEYIDSEKQVNDAPDAVVQMRNAIVHSQIEKRKKLSAIDDRAKYEALQLCLWYIEMALLKILEFDDEYYNRTINSNTKMSKSLNYVPWTKLKTE